MFSLRDIVGAVSRYTIPIPKHKFHLCVCSVNGYFLFINSRGYPSDFLITSKDYSGLDNEKCYVGCSTLLKLDPRYLLKNKGKKYGELSLEAYSRLLEHIKMSPVLPAIEKEKIFSGE